MVYSVSIELYLLRGFYNWQRGWFSWCKGINFLVKMSFKDLEIGGIRQFPVNSVPSSVNTKWRRFRCAGPGVQYLFDVLPNT